MFQKSQENEVTINGTTGHEFEGEQGGMCRKAWWEEKERKTVIIL